MKKEMIRIIRENWPIMVSCVIGIIAGAFVFNTMSYAEAEQTVVGPPCIYEVLIWGDSINIGWTTPPCDANLDPLNPRQHAVMYHGRAKMAACGAAAVYRLPQFTMPAVDTTFNDTGSLCPPLGPKVTDDG